MWKRRELTSIHLNGYGASVGTTTSVSTFYQHYVLNYFKQDSCFTCSDAYAQTLSEIADLRNDITITVPLRSFFITHLCSSVPTIAHAHITHNHRCRLSSLRRSSALDVIEARITHKRPPSLEHALLIYTRRHLTECHS